MRLGKFERGGSRAGGCAGGIGLWFWGEGVGYGGAGVLEMGA